MIRISACVLLVLAVAFGATPAVASVSSSCTIADGASTCEFRCAMGDVVRAVVGGLGDAATGASCGGEEAVCVVPCLVGETTITSCCAASDDKMGLCARGLVLRAERVTCSAHPA